MYVFCFSKEDEDMERKDLTGQKFGRLKVLYRTEDKYYPSGRHDVQYRCICDCGNEVDVLGIHLRSGHTQSCGCFRVDTTKKNMTTHGKTNTRIYTIWKNMKERCNNKNHDDYGLYGGRGISVCKEWENDFTAFEKWANDNGYREDLTIDRKDVNGNYEPNNCRWVTQKEQCNNTRRNIVIEFNNEKHTLKEWSNILKIPYYTLYSRIYRGWDYKKAFETK